MGLYSRAQLEKDLAAVEAFDQEVSRKVAAGEISGFAAIELGRECERKIRSLRMKLVNAGQLISDLRAATVEEQTGSERGKSRLQAAWRKIRWNSDGSPGQAVEEPQEPLRAPQGRELRLDAPEDQPAIQRAVNARQRMLWRPRGREVVVVFED